ncbi:dihydrodipicolinate synthase family protein [Cryptosporangium sp. NPDC051539]|uniref:dihydrodipicolinate synthase family protein n=1 Tax=Cryptosporangium sp. NPDC051539 TaxID=3363962 RepID=UPI0037A7B3C9
MTLTGLFVPLITPFDADGGVARAALERLASEMVGAGVSGLVALGTTAETGSLTAPERAAVLDVVATVCRARSVPLVVGAGTGPELAALAGRPEVVAALTVVPPFVRPGEAGVIAQFRTLAAASPVPLIVYDVPLRTGQYLSAAALRELAAIPGVAGVKHCGLTADTVELLAGPPRDFAILAGEDVLAGPLLALGAHGAILASAHCATDAFVSLVRAWEAGDVATARALGAGLSRVSSALFAAPNPAVIKAVLHAQGRIPTPDVRLPLLAAPPELAERAIAAEAAVRDAVVEAAAAA